MYWWIPLLLTAASGAANYQSQRKTDKARARVMEADRLRRAGQEKKSEASAQNTTDLLLKAKEQEGERAAEVEAAMAEEPPNPTMAAPLTSPVTSTGAKVQTVPSAHEARAKDYANRVAKNQAALRSFGDVMGMTDILTGRNAQDINQTNISMRNWAANVLPAQLAHANLAGRDWATAADIMQLAAALTSGYAWSSAGAGAGAAGAGSAGSGAASSGAASAAAAAPLVTQYPSGTTTLFDRSAVPASSSALGTTTNFMQPSAQELEWYRFMNGGKTPPAMF